MSAKRGQGPKRPDFDSPRGVDLFRRTTKRELWEIAFQFGMRIADDFSEEGGLDAMEEEKRTLKEQGIL